MTCGTRQAKSDVSTIRTLPPARVPFPSTIERVTVTVYNPSVARRHRPYYHGGEMNIHECRVEAEIHRNVYQGDVTDVQVMLVEGVSLSDQPSGGDPIRMAIRRALAARYGCQEQRVIVAPEAFG